MLFNVALEVNCTVVNATVYSVYSVLINMRMDIFTYMIYFYMTGVFDIHRHQAAARKVVIH